MSEKIQWRRDWITDEWREEHKKELSMPLEELSPGFLGEAITYCRNNILGKNPFAEEIIRQAGCMEEYRKAYFRKDKIRIFDKACESFGFHLY